MEFEITNLLTSSLLQLLELVIKPYAILFFAECSVKVDRKEIKWHSLYHEDRDLLVNFYKKKEYCNGTFVEMGALDGDRKSNTWVFEEYFKWTGLLIEANPINAQKLIINRPKVGQLCLRVYPYFTS